VVGDGQQRLQTFCFKGSGAEPRKASQPNYRRYKEWNDCNCCTVRRQVHFAHLTKIAQASKPAEYHGSASITPFPVSLSDNLRLRIWECVICAVTNGETPVSTIPSPLLDFRENRCQSKANCL
jgi:hypothetical protein